MKTKSQFNKFLTKKQKNKRSHTLAILKKYWNNISFFSVFFFALSIFIVYFTFSVFFTLLVSLCLSVSLSFVHYPELFRPSGVPRPGSQRAGVFLKHR